MHWLHKLVSQWHTEMLCSSVRYTALYTAIKGTGSLSSKSNIRRSFVNSSLLSQDSRPLACIRDFRSARLLYNLCFACCRRGTRYWRRHDSAMKLGHPLNLKGRDRESEVPSTRYRSGIMLSCMRKKRQSFSQSQKCLELLSTATLRNYFTAACRSLT